MLCSDLENEHATLLLYKLLHENAVMKAFVLSRTDSEKLTEPLLKVGDTTTWLLPTLLGRQLPA